MGQRILIIDGHPDPDPKRLGHALAHIYAEAATAGGHEIKQLTLAHLQIPPLSSRFEWEQPATGVIKDCQDAVLWANHIVIIYPLWLGALPALTKAFFEQVFRPSFAFDRKREGTLSPGYLEGKSARIIVTTGMPGWFYRWFFFSLTLRSLKRNILYYVKIAPVSSTIIGSVEEMSPKRFDRVRETVAKLAQTAR
jgi:putative NADPH-quinone reductase